MSESANTPSPGRRWPRILIMGGSMAAGIVIGAAGLAGAAMVQNGGMGGPMGWHHHGPGLARIQGFVRTSLDSVAATSDQEAKVHDIIASAFADLAPNPDDRMAFRQKAIDILKAPTLDKAALEKLRGDFVAQADAKSKRFVDAVEQIAEVLTPDQRTKLADRAEAWSHRGPMQGDGHPRPWGPGGRPGPQDPDEGQGGPQPDNN